MKTEREINNTHMQDITSKSKAKKDTNICLESHRAKLMLYQGGGVKNHLEIGKEEAHLLFSLGHVL